MTSSLYQLWLLLIFTCLPQTAFAIDLPNVTDFSVDRINWASSARGASVTGSTTNESFTQQELIDGLSGPNNKSVGITIDGNSFFLINLGQPRSIHTLQLHLRDADNRYYQYRIEYSLDGNTFHPLIDRTQGEQRGIQRLEFPETTFQYYRIIGTFCSNENQFRLIDELFAIGDVQTTPFSSQQISINGVQNAGSTYSVGKSIELQAGIYEITYTQGAIASWNNDNENNGRTWRGVFDITIPIVARNYSFLFNHNLLDSFATVSETEANRIGKSFTIRVPVHTLVYFWHKDTIPGDNRGSITATITQLSGPNDSLLEQVRDAMVRSVLWEQREVASWERWVGSPNNRGCYGCHTHSQASFGLVEAHNKLSDLQVDTALISEFVDSYLEWQNPEGWVSPEHGSRHQVTQTSLWAWSVANLPEDSFEKIASPLINALNWLLTKQITEGGWDSDHNSTILYTDGGPSAAHTAGNIYAYSKIVNLLSQKSFRPFQNVIITENTITHLKNSGPLVDLVFDTVENITAFKLHISDSFYENGNFVLSEIQPSHNGQQLVIQNAAANFQQSDYPIKESFNSITNDNNDGWAIYPQNSTNTPAEAVWIFNEPKSLNELRLLMTYPGHQLEKYSISVTTDPQPTLSSNFTPITGLQVGYRLRDSNGVIANYKAAVERAVNLFLSSKWDYKRNTRTAAQTLIGLNDALPILSPTQSQLAKEKIAEIAQYLRLIQGPDGGWSDAKNGGGDSNIFPSAQALRALLLSLDQGLDETIIDGANYLLTRQTSTGAWSAPQFEKQLAVTTWVQIALPTIFDVLLQQARREAINDLTAEGNINAVDLYWAPVEGAVSYNVYRRLNATSLAKIANAHTTNVATYRDVEATNEVTYYYVVRWLNEFGMESEDSNEASATPAGLVCGGDTPPVITSPPVTGAIVTKPYRYQVQAYDNDANDVLTYSLTTAPSSMSINPATGEITWMPGADQGGTHLVRVRVQDSIGRFATQAYRLIASTIIVNVPPSFTSTPIITATSKHPYRYRAKAKDENPNDVLTYSLTTAPAAMAINSSTGQISWTPNDQQTGNHSVGVKVVDAGGLFATQAFTIAVSQNRPPEILTQPVTTAAKNKYYVYDANATDPDHDRITFSLVQQPGGMIIEPITGRITWTPTSNTVGTFTVKVKASDEFGLFAEQAFSLVVKANEAPEITSTAITTASVGFNYTYQVTAYDPEGSSLTYTLPSSPSGMSISTTGYISWLPVTAQLGSHPVIVRVTDNLGLKAEQSFDIFVEQNPIPTLAVVSPTPGAKISEKTNVIGTIAVLNNKPLTWKTYLTAVDGTSKIELASGTSSVNTGVIGTIDPSLLVNNAYIFVIEAFTNNKLYSQSVPYDIIGRSKLGEFKLSFTDLSIPLSGVSLHIGRNYSSIDKSQGEFGIGWQMQLPGRVVDNTPEDQAMPYGARVFVTKANGERVGFTFQPYQISILVPMYKAYFRPDPGVNDFLEVEDSGLFFSGGRFFKFTGAFNPSTYLLTTRDRVRYTIDEDDGLLEIQDANKNVITFTSTAITHSSGTRLKVDKDEQDRIVRITDLNGKSIAYNYDTFGDLIAFTNQLNEKTIYRYDNNHLLLEIEDSTGVILLQNIFDADGRLIGQKDSNGNQLAISIDTNANTETIVDRRGNSTKNSYDAAGNLVEIENALGQKTRFTYDANFNHLSTIDTAGNTTRYTYDSNSNLTSETDPLGNITRYTHNNFGQILSETNALGASTSKQYDGFGNLIRETDFSGFAKSSKFDARGNLIAHTDTKGKTTEFNYDSSGRVTQITNALGDDVTLEYDANGNLLSETREVTEANSTKVYRTTATYNALGQITKLINPEGKSTSITYNHLQRPVSITDANGKTTTIVYDSRGNKTKTTYPDGSFETITHDANDNPLTLTDRRGNTTAYEYDKLNRVVKVTHPDTTTSLITYDTAGRRSSVSDEAGRTTNVAFDAAGRVTKTTDPLGNSSTISYDAVGNRLKEIDAAGKTTDYLYDANNRVLQVTNSAGSFIAFIYDSEGNLTAQQNERGDTVEYQYDALGQLSRITDALNFATHYAYDEVGNQIAATDEAGNTSTMTYDGQGLLRLRKLPNGDSESYNYDSNGNLLSKTDFLGKTTSYQYDSENRLIKTTDANNGITTVTYDNEGNRTSLKDPVGNTTQFAYDSRNRLITTTDPLGKTTTTTYDSVGNIKTITNRLGLERARSYDALDRLTQETWKQSNTVVRTLSYNYDKVGNILSANDSSSSYSYNYDTRDRLTRVDNSGTPGAAQVVLNYTYDDTDNIVQIVDNLGVTVSSTYNANNSLASRSWFGGSISPAHLNFTYGPRGELSRIDRYSNLAATQLVASSITTYDELARVKSTLHQNQNQSPLAALTYQYDKNSRLIKEIYKGVSTNYQYNNTGQLLTVTPDTTPTETFSYDLNGNRNSTGYTVTANNQITTNGTFNFSYDAEGNIISKTEIATGNITSFKYDHRNRLTSVIKKNSSNTVLSIVTFDYDIDNKRIAKTVNGITSHYIYDRDHVWLEHDSAKNITARYLYTESIDEILARWTPNDGTAWYLTDKLGSVRDLVDSSGNSINQTSYSAFGKIIAQTDPAKSDRYTFTGREYDKETGLYYYRARYYDPDLGSFISQDPIGFDAGDTNLKRYVGNGPGNATDPTGTQIVEYGNTLRIATTIASAASRAPVLTVIQGGAGLTAEATNSAYALGFAKSAATKFLVIAVTITLANDGPNVKTTRLADGTIIKEAKLEVDRENVAVARKVEFKCPPHVYRKLYLAYQISCKLPPPPSCEFGLDREEAQKRANWHQRCADDRKNINNTCFEGGDPGHREAARNAARAAQACRNVAATGKR